MKTIRIKVLDFVSLRRKGNKNETEKRKRGEKKKEVLRIEKLGRQGLGNNEWGSGNVSNERKRRRKTGRNISLTFPPNFIIFMF